MTPDQVVTSITAVVQAGIADLEAQRAAEQAACQVAGAAKDQQITDLNAQVVTLKALIAQLQTSANYGPVSIPDWATAVKTFNLDATAPVVTWPADQTLEQFCANGPINPNAYIWAPESAKPYLVDSADGFRAAGVGAVDGANGTKIPIVNKYAGKAARTWFAMARVGRGIVGGGPGCVITTTDSGFKQAAQIPDKSATTPGRFYYDANGVKKSELVGCAEKVIECNTADGFFGNFTMQGRDFGGVAYHALSLNKGGTFARINPTGAWRGFDKVPNGEAGAFTVTTGRYLVSHCFIDGRDANGKRVGSSPVMINSSPGGRIENTVIQCSVKGMPTMWNCSGTHEWVNVDSLWNESTAVNLEQAKDGFTFTWTGGHCWANRGGKGGNPSPDGIYGTGMHIGLNALGKATIVLTDVDLDANIQPGKLCIQTYSTASPAKVKVTCTKDGKAVPVAAYGTSGVIALGS